MKKTGTHVCRERAEFEVLTSAYPHAIFRCRVCRSPMRSSPMDDLDSTQLDLAVDMLSRYRRRRRGDMEMEEE